MKKIFIMSIMSLFIFGNNTFADGDLWDNFGDQNYYGNKAVSDADFKKAIEIKKGNKKPKKEKGETYQQSNETEVINQIPAELPVLSVTCPVKLPQDAVLPTGHYQVVSEKIDNKIYLKLYQGHFLMASLEAIETLDDFEQPEVNFAGFIPSGDKFKIIYGSIDYNAYVDLEPEIYENDET